MCEHSVNEPGASSTDYYVAEAGPDQHLNRSSIRKDRKRVGDPGGPVKDRSRAKGIGQKRSKG